MCRQSFETCIAKGLRISVPIVAGVISIGILFAALGIAHDQGKAGVNGCGRCMGNYDTGEQS